MPVGALDSAEESLQNWLNVKPPPAYLERHLIHDGTRDSKEVLRRYTAAFMPEYRKYLDLFTGYRIAERESIDVLNAISGRKHVSRLSEASETLRDVLAREGRSYTPGDRARGLALLGYMTTELFSAQALHIIQSIPMILMPAEEQFTDAIGICTEACHLAIQEGDYFTLSRAAYNLGCLLHDLGTELNDAIGWLNVSFSAGEAHFKRSDQTDVTFSYRRLNTLHRLVEIWAKHEQNAFGVESYAPLLKGRFSSFSETSEYRQDRQSDPPIGNRGVLPLLQVSTTLAETMKMIEATTALVSYLNGDRYTSLTLVQAGRALVTLFSPDFEHVGGWDVFFRPTNVEFEASLRQIPDKQKHYGMNVTLEMLLTGVAAPAICETDQSGGDPSGPKLTWSVGRDYLEVTAALDNWVSVPRREYVQFDESVDWQSKLCELLVTPLIPKLSSSITHLVISPDGGMNVIPFHLLRLENQLLFDRYSFSYTPTLEILSRLLSLPARSERPPRMLVVSDATRTLLGARREAQEIQELFGPNAKVLGPDDVTVDRIRAEARDVELLHFCGHARFDSSDLEHSGLLLSGNHWMTINEIASLQMQAGSTVFLSACQTGRVAIRSTGDSLGLHHAFIAAGASSVISSFWEVHDISTTLLVRRFYQEFILEEQSRQESLRRAMMWVRSATVSDVLPMMGSEITLPNDYNAPFADPFFWAAFVLYGDWR